MNSLISCAWWHQTPPATTPLQALRLLLSAIEQNQPVSAAAAVVVVPALKAYLDGQTTDLTGALGLRPRRGGRNETPLALERKQARDSGIRWLYEKQDGCKTEKAGKVATLLKTPPDAANVTEEEVFAYLLDLHREHGGNLPTSMRQVLRVVEGDCTASGER